jgi:hypothetical protein
MKLRFSEFLSPLLAPDHESDDWEEGNEDAHREDEPGPEIADGGSEGEREVADDKGEAATEVEEDAGLGGLWLVAVGDVGVEGCAGDLEAWERLVLGWDEGEKARA